MLMLNGVTAPAQAAAGLTSPRSPSASAVSNQAIRLSWSDANKRETGHEIERSQSASSGFARIATASKNSTSYQDTNLAPGSTYYYRVRAIGRKGAKSAYSSVVGTTTPNVAADTTAPSVTITSPGSGSTFTSAQTVTLAASASDNVGVTQVRFYQNGVLRRTDTTAPYTHGWSVTSAANGSHSWTAKAYDAAGNSRTSGAVSLTVNVATADTIAPSVTITSPNSGSTFTSAQTVTLNASASDNIGVAQVRFYQNGVLRHTDTTAPYAHAWPVTSAANGSHSWTARAYDAAGNSRTSGAVSLTVNVATADTTAPSITITSPGSGSSYTSAQTVTLAASASDNVGVTQVRFYQNGSLRRIDLSAPYTHSWSVTSSNNGNHSWTAQAYDAAGNSRVSSAVSTTVNIGAADTSAPSVTITSPGSGSTYTSARTVTLNASASDNVGVTQVRFYQNGVLRHTDTTAPYTHGWPVNSAANGSHSWTAQAYDAAGNNRTSSAVSLTVNIATADTSAPSVTITGPGSGSTFTSAQTVTLAASASDNVGVTRVQFFQNGTLRHTDTSAPYSHAWPVNATANGSHSWTAKAFDAAGNNATSSAVSLTVNIAAADTSAPSVTITSPGSGSTFTSAQTVTMAASASDNVGVSTVEFRQNGVLRHTDTSAPYTHYWSVDESANGNHSWTANAIDAAGNSRTSSAVSLTVDIGPISGDGGVHWARAIGGPSDDRGLAIALDSGGDILLSGSFKGTVDFGGGAVTSTAPSWRDPNDLIDIFVAKYSSQTGTHMWSQNFGTTADDNAYGVAVDGSDRTVVTGLSQGQIDLGGGANRAFGMSDMFLAQYSGANATHRWSATYGGSGTDTGNAVAIDVSDNIVVVGAFNDNADFGGGRLSSASLSSDVFVAKFSSTGNHLWSRGFGGIGADSALAVAVDGSGNVFVAGHFIDSASLGGSTLASAGGYDIFVAKYSPSGAHLWSKRLGGSGHDYAKAIAVDGAGEVVVTGTFKGNANFGGGNLASAGGDDVFLAKYSPNGSHLWSQRFGSSGVDAGYGLATDSNDDVVVTGYFSNSVSFGGPPLDNNGGYDVFVAKFTPDGVPVWSQGFGGSGYDFGTAATVDGVTGDVIVTGYFQGAAAFGSESLTSAGSFDIFLLSLEP